MTLAYTHDNDQEIAALYLSGETGYSIARRFGVTDPTIYRALDRQGVARRPGGRRTNWEDTESNRRDLVAAYEGGESVRSLARQLCIRTSRVTQVLDESGVQLHPGGRLRFTDEQAAEFARRYRAGESLTQVGRRYGVAAKVIRDYLIRSGVTIRPLGAPAFWTEARKTEAVRRYQTGEQLKDIAAAMGCGCDTLTRTLVELGVHEKKRWELRGEAHHSWQGGRTVRADGYVHVRVTDADRDLADVTRTGYVLEHRLIMARLLGRRLLKGETVHHIDNDRQNNEPGNLQLRQGKHGKGAVFRCASCGSHDIEAVSLA